MLRGRVAALVAISSFSSGAGDVLGELERRATHSMDALDLFRLLYDSAAQLLDATGFYLGLYEAATQTVEIVRQMDSGTELPGGAFPLSEGFTSQVIRTRQPHVTGRWFERGPHVQVQYATSHVGLPQSGITIPLIGPASNDVLGILAVQSYRPDAYSTEDVETFERIGSAAARVIERWRRRERAQAEFTRRSTELQAILASMSEGLIITDTQGAVVRLNGVARSLLVPPTERIVLGQPLDRERLGQLPLAERSVSEAFARLVGILRREETRHETELDVWKNGHRTLSLSASPLRDGEGALAGGVIVIRDVTEQRALDRLKAQVLQIASHDLQAPLTVVKGRAQHLERMVGSNSASPEMLRTGLTTIVAQTDRLSDMLRMLLDLSRVEGGRLELHRSETDLVPLITEVVEGARLISQKHDIQIDAPSRVIGIWDGPRLRQVVQNLVSNAVKYSPAGGRIDVRVDAPGDQVRVAVCDQGLGMTAEETTRVFDQFYRAAGARRLEGSGLGLYICHAIIAAHDGHIWVASGGPGQGSTFTFALPVSAPARMGTEES